MRHLGCIGGLLLALLGAAASAGAAPITLYSTQFESAQGFYTTNALAGKNGWIGVGTGGNGVGSGYITGFGQSAFLGYLPAVDTSGLFLYRPVNHTPTNLPLVTFTVDFTIFDSSTTNRDEFRWSIYNIAGQRLFSLGFDNRDLSIFYQLDDGVFRETGYGFVNEDVYSLTIAMNFASNRWTASLGGTVVVSNALLTTGSAARTFGDADAVWLRGNPARAGDNYLVFDNYTVTADALPAPPPATAATVQPLGFVGGQFLLRVTGQSGASYALEATSNLLHWTALKTNLISGGSFDHLDTASAGQRHRFYRARWVP